MGGDALAAQVRLVHGHRDFLVAHPGGAGGGRGCEVVAREVELDRVDAVLEEHADDLAHVVGAVDDDTEAELRIRDVGSLVTEAAGHRDLLARRQVARPRDQALLDRVADDHVEAWLGAGGADARRPAQLQIAPGDAGRPQHVLLQRHPLDLLQGGGVVPREVRVRLHHPRHERGPGAVDHGGAGGRERPRAVTDPRDPVALHEHLAGVGRRPVPSRIRTLLKRVLPMPSS